MLNNNPSNLITGIPSEIVINDDGREPYAYYQGTHSCYSYTRPTYFITQIKEYEPKTKIIIYLYKDFTYSKKVQCPYCQRMKTFTVPSLSSYNYFEYYIKYVLFFNFLLIIGAIAFSMNFNSIVFLFLGTNLLILLGHPSYIYLKTDHWKNYGIKHDSKDKLSIQYIPNTNTNSNSSHPETGSTVDIGTALDNRKSFFLNKSIVLLVQIPFKYKIPEKIIDTIDISLADSLLRSPDLYNSEAINSSMRQKNIFNKLPNIPFMDKKWQNIHYMNTLNDFYTRNYEKLLEIQKALFVNTNEKLEQILSMVKHYLEENLFVQSMLCFESLLYYNSDKDVWKSYGINLIPYDTATKTEQQGIPYRKGVTIIIL